MFSIGTSLINGPFSSQQCFITGGVCEIWQDFGMWWTVMDCTVGSLIPKMLVGYPRCSMVLEYLPTCIPKISKHGPNEGTYSIYVEHLGMRGETYEVVDHIWHTWWMWFSCFLVVPWMVVSPMDGKSPVFKRNWFTHCRHMNSIHLLVFPG